MMKFPKQPLGHAMRLLAGFQGLLCRLDNRLARLETMRPKSGSRQNSFVKQEAVHDAAQRFQDGHVQQWVLSNEIASLGARKLLTVRAKAQLADSRAKLAEMTNAMKKDLDELRKTARDWIAVPFDDDPPEITRDYLQAKRASLAESVATFRVDAESQLLHRLCALPPEVLFIRLRSLFSEDVADRCFHQLLRLRASGSGSVHAVRNPKEEAVETFMRVGSSIMSQHRKDLKISCPIRGVGRIPYTDNNGHRRYREVLMDGMATGKFTVKSPRFMTSDLGSALTKIHAEQLDAPTHTGPIDESMSSPTSEQPMRRQVLQQFLQTFREALEQRSAT